MSQIYFIFSSVQFSRSVVSDSLQPHVSQHARPPCPSPTPRVHSDSTSIESVMPSSHLILCRPLFLLPPIPPSIRVFSNESTLRMRWPKYWVSASASFLPKKSQDWSPLEWTGWISLQSLDCKEIKPVNPKENQSWIFIGRTDAEAETPILWPPDAKNWLIWKDPDAGKDWRREEKGMTEDEMVGWHHWLYGHEFEQALADGMGQGSLACCSLWSF